MTRSWFQSGTHMAERICWIRIDCPASNRPSARASDVRTATRFWMTDSTIVWEKVSPASPDSFPRCRASIGTSLPSSPTRTTTARSTGRCSKRRSTTRPRISWTSRARMSVLATWTRISKILLRATAEVDRLPDWTVELVALVLRNVLLEVEVPVEVGDRPDERRGRVADAPAPAASAARPGASSRTVSEKVPTVRTSPGAIGEEATKRPLTFTPFVEFWSTMTQRSFSRRMTRGGARRRSRSGRPRSRSTDRGRPPVRSIR